jgi:hypothetical protein
MAKVRFHAEFTAEGAILQKLMKALPEIRAMALGFIGDEAKHILYNTFLRGQSLNYTGLTDKKNRRTVGYEIGKRAMKVSIRSYPANLFEEKRPNYRPSGKYIITRKLKNVLNPLMGSIVNNFDRMYLQKKIEGM